MRIPIFNVDPREVGPIELLRAKLDRYRQWASEPIITLAHIGAIALIGYGWIQSGASLPEIPNWGWIALGTMLLGTIVAWRISGRLAAELYNPDMVRLSILDAYSGDQKLVKVPPEHFADATIVNHDWSGEEPTDDVIVGRERLHTVIINGKKHYEVEKYDPVLNVARTSWQADRSGNEIRTDHDTLTHIRTEMEEQVDTVYEVLARETQVIRKSTAMQVNKFIAAAQDSELPEEAEVSSHQSMRDLLEDEGVDRDLLDEQAPDDAPVDPDEIPDEDPMTDIEI